MKFIISFLLIFFLNYSYSQNTRPRDLGIKIGIIKPGKENAITDVEGVMVGHVTLIEADNIRTGVTAILPHTGNIFQEKVPAAIYVGNGFGKLAGSTQVEELGNIETPIILTNTLSVANAINGVISYTLSLDSSEQIRSVNAIVGETNDGFLNDIRGRHVSEDHVLQAITSAKNGPVKEGNIGAGTGTRCFRFKGGIGTASRRLPETMGGYTVGVLVQTNFGGVLEIAGIPMAKEIKDFPTYDRRLESADGSCMIVIATDAPLSSRNLNRLAKRAMMGLGKTGGIASNGSGDYVIAFSTFKENRIPYRATSSTQSITELNNGNMSSLFLAVIEATEESIINSLFAAEDMKGRAGNSVKALPIDEVIKALKKHGRSE